MPQITATIQVIEHYNRSRPGLLERLEIKFQGQGCAYIGEEVFELARPAYLCPIKVWPSSDLNRGLLIPGDRFELGPLRLIVVGHDNFGCGYIVALDSWQAQVSIRLDRLRRPLDKAYRRAIITLAVWNLATIPRHVIPIAQHVHLIARLSQVRSRLHARLTGLAKRMLG